ncbi:MAG: 50S ribosomal protein L9 [Planctomycetota bacterium]
MQLLLLQDVRKLGHLGDVVEVSAGYARNYLLPQRLATEPTEENIKAIEERRKAAAAERALRLKRYTELVEQLAGVSVTIEAAANPEGTLYGSVSAKDIAAALAAQGFPIEAEHVMLDAPIRTIDSRMVKLEFADEIATEIKVWVVREGGAPDVDQADSTDAADTTAAESDAAQQP